MVKHLTGLVCVCGASPLGGSVVPTLFATAAHPEQLKLNRLVFLAQ